MFIKQRRDPAVIPPVPEPSLSGPQIARRQISSLGFEFLSDNGERLGTMERRSRRVLHGTTTTPTGSYRSQGSGSKHQMVDLATGTVILGNPVGLLLPDGRPLSAQKSRGFAEATYSLSDSDGRALIRLAWLPPVNPRYGDFPLGVASLDPTLVPSVELVPLLSYTFQLFTSACTIYRSG